MNDWNFDSHTKAMVEIHKAFLWKTNRYLVIFFGSWFSEYFEIKNEWNILNKDFSLVQKRIYEILDK